MNANLLALISPADGTVRATVPLLGPPADVAAAPGSLWVAEADAHQVVRINPKRRAVTATIPVGTAPSRIIAGGGQVWVLDRADHTVSRIDPQADTVAQTIALGGKPSDLLLTAGSLWVADQGDGTVLRIDPATGRTQGITRTGGDPSWPGRRRRSRVGGHRPVGDPGADRRPDRHPDQHDPRRRRACRHWDGPSRAVGARPAGRDGLPGGPAGWAVTATIPLGGAPTAMVQSGGGVWLADRRNGTLLRLAPRHEMVTRFRLGGHLRALAATGGDLWAAVDAAGPGHRGGTLTSSTSYAKIDTIDPAAGNSNNLVPSQFLGLINDGLVTLDHIAGPDGSRLVPDLALALPPPSGRGRTYTFHLRPGIRYSTGALVRPSDVTRSFERLFQLGSSGVSYYRAITGTAACLRAPRTCDLSAGIAADDRAGTVTFHLDQPDPDFLYKLTLAYADVLPAASPGRQAQTPLPATGPYLISRYLPGRELVLVRNPRFREWNAAAQPAGYPGRIRIRLDLGPAQGAAAVAHGEVDFMPNLGQNLASTGYFSQHQDQLRINPVMITDFMFLNVRTPPFNDVRVRQAVNLALDRGLVVNHFGGPVAARPTCQIMPPAWPATAATAPTPATPAAGGAWHGPDLPARPATRRSIRHGRDVGHCLGHRHAPRGPSTRPRDARDHAPPARLPGLAAAAAGKHLLRLHPRLTQPCSGHRRRLERRLPLRRRPSSASSPAATSLPATARPPATAASSATRPWTGRSPGPPPCRPPTRQAAAARWAQLDRQLTDLAVFLPTVTPNEVDLLSRRGATSSTTRSGERSSTSSGSAESPGGDVGVGHAPRLMIIENSRQAQSGGYARGRRPGIRDGQSRCASSRVRVFFLH